MGTLYVGTRCFYEENGELWDSPRKQTRFDPVTFEMIVVDSAQPPAEVPVVAVPAAVENKCPDCGFVAKSKAGLSVHALSHKHGTITTSDKLEEWQ